jgi:hypothetical protein
MRKSLVMIATAATVLLGGAPLASAQTNGDQTVVHVPQRLQAQQHRKGSSAYGYVRGHTDTRREPAGGLIQDKGYREGVNGQHGDSLVPLNR